MPPSKPSESSTLLPSSSSRAIVLTEIEALGGAERSVLALCRWLHQHHLPHHVVTYIDHVGLAKHAVTPLQVVELRPPMQARTKIAALRRYFHDIPRSAPRPLMSGYQPALHATIAGVRGFHCLMHDTPSLFENAAGPAAGSNAKRRLVRRLCDGITGYGLRSGGVAVVTSEYLQAECRRTFGVSAAIARMGGLTAVHEFRPRRVAGTLNLLSVSRLEANKRLDWLLRAFSALEQRPEPLSRSVDWKLHLVGRGAESETLVAMAKELGLASRVHFHGFVPDMALEEMYEQAHLFLMPAVQGYGIPAIEALSRGIPVLLHRDSGVSDILQDTPWATVFSGGEAELLEALQKALGEVSAGEQIGAALPSIPTEAEWAERVATLCNWL